MKEEKLRWRNFPLWIIKDLISVACMGEEKYGTYDYLDKEYTVNDHLDALKRHLMKYEDPEENDLDHESGKLHLYHVAWRALVAAYVHKTKPQLDDRYKPSERTQILHYNPDEYEVIQTGIGFKTVKKGK